MEIKVYTLNSFGKTKDGGNPAGVVLKGDGLSEDEMKKISKEVGFSETAFIKKSNKADFKVEFFTQTEEVELCGHATIAAFSLLLKKGIIKEGTYSQETKAGVLEIKALKGNVIFMEQTKPKFYNCLDKREVADTLNISKGDIVDSLPIQVVSTGLKDIFVPIKSKEILNRIKPNFNKIIELTKREEVIGYHLFTLDTQSSAAANCRNLAPLYGINEEAATGTSSGALSCYLYKNGIIKEENAGSIVLEQGYSMEKPSEILVNLSIENGEIEEVRVGGKASLSGEKLISI